MAVSRIGLGGCVSVFSASATMRGICAMRAMQLAMLVSFGSVDCVSSR